MYRDKCINSTQPIYIKINEQFNQPYKIVFGISSRESYGKNTHKCPKNAGTVDIFVSVSIN